MSFGLSLGIAALESQAVVWPPVGDAGDRLGDGLLVLRMWALAGFLPRHPGRGPALSVGLGLVWALVVENLLRGVGDLLGAVEAFTHAPARHGGRLAGRRDRRRRRPTDPGVLDVLSRERSLVTLAAYVVLVPVATLLLVRRRDVD